MPQRDPVENAADGSIDLYGIADWEVRGWLDRLAVALHAGAHTFARVTIVMFAVSILVSQFLLGGLGAITDPVVGTVTVLSVVPAIGLTGYVWNADVTDREPLGLLVTTFFLGVLFAGFAAVINAMFAPTAFVLTDAFGVEALGLFVVFYVIVGPVEEGVKLLAVRLYAFNDARFSAVVDGAVYGAVAGLGFATIENALYITQTAGDVGMGVFAAGGSVVTVRALAGPGHVIYSAFAGYYLGLAKFSPDRAGPIVVKGLVIAAFVHATYNALVSVLPAFAAEVLGISPFFAFIGFVILYDGLFGYVLVRKLRAYRRAYQQALAGTDRLPDPEVTEFDP
ncbi:PrsW family intramembrane metalloprotease [Halorhabdus sp. BNX81]|uniref:PrsW family intramembrane metalloprotease n=1 Tax=Halorhabdus sp. BNX81 TaxID=2980181 RepID=UPI0023DD5EB0|nr:PrsW family intramembrane metalloprotease [Halorhabdus sp. BNX81]